MKWVPAAPFEGLGTGVMLAGSAGWSGAGDDASLEALVEPIQ